MRVIARLKQGYEGQLLVDVHGSGEEDAAYFTSARAESIAGYLKSSLGREGIEFEGSGNQCPLVANLTFKDGKETAESCLDSSKSSLTWNLLNNLMHPSRLLQS